MYSTLKRAQSALKCIERFAVEGGEGTEEKR